MKFTKRIMVMTFLTVTAAVSTGFAYDYVCNGSQTNCNTNTQNNCNENAQYNCNNNNTVCNNTRQSYCDQNSNTRGCGGYRR